MKTKTRFAWKQFLKNLAIIAIPVALQNMLTTTGSMIDTMMIAPLGETTVGAVGLCAQFSSLMFAGYWGFFGGGMLFFSQYWGAQDDDGIDHSYGLTLTCMMIVGLTFGAFAIFAPETVMKLYTDKENIQVSAHHRIRLPCAGVFHGDERFAAFYGARAHPAVRVNRLGGIEYFPQLGVHLRKVRLAGDGRARRGAGNIFGGGYQRFGHFDFGACTEVPVSVPL